VTLVSPLSPVPTLPRADAAEARPRRVSIVDVDRALVAHLDARELDLAQRYAGVVRIPVPNGPWDPSSMLGECGGGLGILILDGMVGREASFAAGVALEILGPEDLIAPSFGPDVRWSAMRPLTVAVLDPTFAQVAARLPGLSAALSAARTRGRIASRFSSPSPPFPGWRTGCSDCSPSWPNASGALGSTASTSRSH